MGTHACPLPSIWTVLQVKRKLFTSKTNKQTKKRVSDIKVVNSMAEHERKTQLCDLRPIQERLHLSVDPPKQQSVCLMEEECRENGGEKNPNIVKDIQSTTLYSRCRPFTRIHDIVK